MAIEGTYDFLTPGTSLSPSIFSAFNNSNHAGYNNLDKASILDEFAANSGTGLTRNTLGMGNTGGFFKNGNDLGFNLDTANFTLNGLTGIMQLWGANTQRKAIQAQMDLAKENMMLTKKDYDRNLESRAMSAANVNGASVGGMHTAGNSALNRYGTGVLQPRNLAPARRTDEPATATA